MNIIENLISQLEELKQQLNQTNAAEAVEESNIENILLQARQSPFSEHPLVEEDVYTQNLYLTLLVSVLDYDQECFEERALYIAKIYAALNSEQSFESYFARAKKISLEMLQEFFIMMQKQGFSKLFILEALVLLGIHQTKKLTAYIVELASILELTEHQFSLMCNVAKYIVSNDKVKLDRLIEQNIEERFLCPHLFWQISSIFSPKLVYKGTRDDVFTEKDIAHYTSIYLENITIQASDEILFQDLNELKLINVNFKQEEIRIRIINCEKVYIDGMDFSEHQKLYGVTVGNCGDVYISNINLTSAKVISENLFIFKGIKELIVDTLTVKSVMFIGEGSISDFLLMRVKAKEGHLTILSCHKVQNSTLRQSVFQDIQNGFYNSSINKLQKNIDCIFE